MNPYLIEDRNKDIMDARFQAEIEKEQWIDDETDRLLQCFPDSLNEFRHCRLSPDVLKCCYHPSSDEHYRNFIWHLAWEQAKHNYDIQILLGWEEPS